MADVVAGPEQHVAASDLAPLGMRGQQAAVGVVEGFEQQVAVEGAQGGFCHGTSSVGGNRVVQ